MEENTFLRDTETYYCLMYNDKYVMVHIGYRRTMNTWLFDSLQDDCLFDTYDGANKALNMILNKKAPLNYGIIDKFVYDENIYNIKDIRIVEIEYKEIYKINEIWSWHLLNHDVE